MKNDRIAILASVRLAGGVAGHAPARPAPADPAGERAAAEAAGRAQRWDEALRHYPKGLIADADGGRMEGEHRPGGDPCYRRTKADAGWTGFYVHIMEQHATRRMWRELALREPPLAGEMPPLRQRPPP